MAEKTILVARLKQIINQKGKEISEAEAQRQLGDRFYAEAFGYGTEIKPEEQQRLSEIADGWLNSTSDSHGPATTFFFGPGSRKCSRMHMRSQS
jgi:hypothetical protein